MTFIVRIEDKDGLYLSDSKYENEAKLHSIIVLGFTRYRDGSLDRPSDDDITVMAVE